MPKIRSTLYLMVVSILYKEVTKYTLSDVQFLAVFRPIKKQIIAIMNKPVYLNNVNSNVQFFLGMKKLLHCILFTCLLFINSLSLVGQTPSGISIKKDIVYGRAGGVDLKLDIGYPDGTGPFPVIVFMHGGGWQQGDKSHMHK